MVHDAGGQRLVHMGCEQMHLVPGFEQAGREHVSVAFGASAVGTELAPNQRDLHERWTAVSRCGRCERRVARRTRRARDNTPMRRSQASRAMGSRMP